MDEIMFALKDAAIAYLIASTPDFRFPCHTNVCAGNVTISHTATTDVLTAAQDDRSVAVIGYCIDAYGKIDRSDIPVQFLSQTFPDAMSAFRYFDRFAGMYLVLYQDGDKMFLWGDASCSLSICYNISGHTLCAAITDKLVADLLGFDISERSLKIRNGSTVYSQPLPNDLTLYDEIKALLPNHYLDCGSRKAVRVPLGVFETTKQKEIERIIEYTAELADNIAKSYCRDYELALPLTAGTDSRTVLSFYKKFQPSIPCFTFKHAGFTNATADIAIPAKLCQMLHLPYQIIPDETAPPAWNNGIAAQMNPYLDKTEVDNAYTYRLHMHRRADADGSIIDEVGKSTQENAVPTALIRAPFIMCKLHNYEMLTKAEVKKWVEEVKRCGEQEHIADLFAIEQKLGRRVSQGTVMYSLCGINSLNLFNCREIILQWTRIPRKIRSKKYIPYAFLRRNDERLLEIPFNPRSKHITFAKKFWPIFYIATFLKYFWMRIQMAGVLEKH